jgi:hypothetical protein
LELKPGRIDKKIEKIKTRPTQQVDPVTPLTRQNPVKNPVTTR